MGNSLEYAREHATPAPADVAPPETGSRVFQLGKVLTIAAGHAVHDTYTAFLPPLLPQLIENLSMSVTQAGLLVTFLRGPSLLQPLIGHLADRSNGKYFFILGPALTAIGMSLLGVMPNYLALAVLLIVVGLSSACLHAVGPVFIGGVSGQNLGRGAGLWMVGGELGRTLGPVAIVSAVSLLTLRGTALLMVVGLASSLILFLQFKNMPEQHRPASAKKGAGWQALGAMAPVMLPIAGILASRAFMTQALATYLPLFLSQEGASLWLSGAALSVLEAAGVVGALLGGSLSDRLGRRRVLAVALLTATLFLTLFLATGGWLRLPLIVLLGLTVLSINPVLIAMVLESFPDNRALANGIFMALSFLISSGAAVAMGAIADAYGMQAAFVLSVLPALLGLPLIVLLPKKRSGQGLITTGGPSLAEPG